MICTSTCHMVRRHIPHQRMSPLTPPPTPLPCDNDDDTTGVQVPCLSRDKKWKFTPSTNYKVGDLVSGGDIYGSVYENTLIQDHRIMVHPKVTNRRLVPMHPPHRHTFVVTSPVPRMHQFVPLHICLALTHLVVPDVDVCEPPLCQPLTHTGHSMGAVFRRGARSRGSPQSASTRSRRPS